MLIFTLLFTACAGMTDMDHDDTSGGDTNTAACSTVNSGDNWAWNGECPQMKTPCDLVVTGCEIAIDYTADGGMTMDMPKNGTVAGDTVTFDDNGVSGCVGTVLSADEIEGTCDGGCTFTLKR